jgi:protein-S-isoprenylcysteine O-methyltransferase Ste14
MMRISAEYATYWLWAIWYGTWILAAAWASRAASRPRVGGVLHRILASAGVFLLLFVPTSLNRYDHWWWNLPGIHAMARPLWSDPAAVGWTLFVLIGACFAFCWWARLHLGRLWSGFVTTKADHHIVDTGPYRLVRHPIYTGAIFAALFTACIKASPAALLGFALFALGFWMTAEIEERFLRQELGPEAYDAYSRRTPMLIPLLR